MEELLSFQNNLLRQINNDWHRYLYPHLKTQERLLGLKGLRGVGKTTLLLQYLAYDYPDREHGLYVTADHPYFYQHTLFDLASDWSRYGGKLLLIDEVHKYKNWSRELKLIYDGHPELQIIFTSSSALDLYRGESDLSRRLVTQHLHGLSFREYLSFRHGLNFQPLSLEDLLHHHRTHAEQLTAEFQPLPLFRQYLQEGYFPFAGEASEGTFLPRLVQIINTVLESDLAYIQDFSASNVAKMKKLLGVIAESAPFEPNISTIAEKLNLGRNTVYQYLRYLADAYILNLIYKASSGISQLQKPAKIYFENTCFAFALQNAPNVGTLRETFFLNQLRNARHQVHPATKGDFQVDGRWTFEVGGRNKSEKQIKDVPESYLTLDGIESGFGNKIPLWLFGMLY